MAWQAESVQFVLFTSGAHPHSADELWAGLGIGRTLTYSQLPGMPGGSQASGVLNEHGVLLQVQPGRAALALSPQPVPTPGPPLVPDASAALAILLPLAVRLASAFAGVSRLALVVDAQQPVADASESEARVKELAKLDLPAGITDLSLQLNRRRPSNPAGYELNRLCRWQTLTKQLFEFIAPGGGGTMMTPMMAREEHFVGLFVDVNTVPVPEIPSARQEELLQDLAQEVELLLSDAYARLAN